MTREKARILWLIAIGILAMFGAEVSPLWFWWGPPLAIGILRAYIIIESTRIKHNYPEAEKFANRWTVGTSVLVAAYIAALWYRGTIGIDLFMSLQACNIMLIGAELYFSKLSLLTTDRQTIDLQANQIESHRHRIGSLESEIDAHRLRIDKLEKQIASDRHNIDLAKKLIGGVSLSSGTVRACPNCKKIYIVGHRAKNDNHICKIVVK